MCIRGGPAIQQGRRQRGPAGREGVGEGGLAEDAGRRTLHLRVGFSEVVVWAQQLTGSVTVSRDS